jgi:DNA (cytosine-5)-methyltransferase 1
VQKVKRKPPAASKFLSEIETALKPLADACVPAGTQAEAVAHQWAHALAADRELVGGVSRVLVVQLLTERRLFEDVAQFARKLYSNIAFPPASPAEFAFIDLFAGIGGFRQALQGLGGYCAFSSEWDKGAQQTYYANYGELPFGDLTELTHEGIPESQILRWIPNHDILAAGFPCQPFSHAGVSARVAVGKEHGFECKTQGTLFFDLMRVAAARKPKVLFLENVRNIERHDGTRTMQVIRESIDSIGYDFTSAIIDSSTLVPQRRKRCYMVCFRKDLEVNFKFPEVSGDPRALAEILESAPDPSYTISDKLWLGHQNRTARNLERGTGFTAFTADLQKPSNTLVARYGKDGKECLVPQGDRNPRLLTPRECARLQGYPEKFVLPVSRTPAYKQFGNSVAVPVISLISQAILEALR